MYQEANARKVPPVGPEVAHSGTATLAGRGHRRCVPLSSPVLATLHDGIRRRSDLHGDLHGQMIRRRTIPIALQRDSIARVMHDRDADEILISDNAARRIEIDPARTGNVDLHPGMGVAAGQFVLVVIVAPDARIPRRSARRCRASAAPRSSAPRGRGSCRCRAKACAADPERPSGVAPRARRSGGWSASYRRADRGCRRSRRCGRSARSSDRCRGAPRAVGCSA